MTTWGLTDVSGGRAASKARLTGLLGRWEFPFSGEGKCGARRPVSLLVPGVSVLISDLKECQETSGWKSCCAYPVFCG
jgi:hypothetical protein